MLTNQDNVVNPVEKLFPAPGTEQVPNIPDCVFRTPEELSPAFLENYWKRLLAEDKGERNLLVFLLDLVQLLEKIWPLLVEKKKGPGRRPKTRLGQFLFFIYLRYFFWIQWTC